MERVSRFVLKSWKSPKISFFFWRRVCNFFMFVGLSCRRPCRHLHSPVEVPLQPSDGSDRQYYWSQSPSHVFPRKIKSGGLPVSIAGKQELLLPWIGFPGSSFHKVSGNEFCIFLLRFVSLCQRKQLPYRTAFVPRNFIFRDLLASHTMELEPNSRFPLFIW